MTFIIFGLIRKAILLGTKIDECATCGLIGPHVLVRRTRWIHLFWIPVVFLGFAHGMICSRCGAWTGIPWRTMREGLKGRSLPLDRPRPQFLALEPDETGHRPTVEATLDPVVAEHKRGRWDMYMKVWPALVVLVLVSAVVVTPRTASGATYDSGLQDKYGTAHDCWEDATHTISGCRMTDGSIEGDQAGTPIVCYFNEPLADAQTKLDCDR